MLGYLQKQYFSRENNLVYVVSENKPVSPQKSVPSIDLLKGS